MKLEFFLFQNNNNNNKQKKVKFPKMVTHLTHNKN